MIRKISAVFLALTSIVMLYQGLIIAYHTTGLVRGGEFQMLITLSNQFAYFMIWLASLAFFLMATNLCKSKTSEADKG